MSSSKRYTVADMLALKGQRQITMLYVDTVDEAAAAAAAGIDMLSIIQPVWTAEMRAAAGACFVQVGLLYGELAPTRTICALRMPRCGSAATAATAPPVWTPSAACGPKASR
jgi:ketopantoate hydroxymethyltransferase